MPSKSMATRQVSPFFAFFIVTVAQVGVGIFTFQQTLVAFAGHDGWIAIVLSALMVHVIVWLIYKMLHNNHTIVDVHQTVLGRGLGAFVSLYFLLYYCLFSLVTIVAYTDVLRVWLFPEVEPWVFFIILMILGYLFTMGGLRRIIGASVLAMLLSLSFLFLNRLPYGQMQMGSLIPIGNHSAMDLWLATEAMTFQYLGVEILLMAYPFFKEAPRSHKWAQLGVAFSMMTYLVCFILTALYFDEHHLATLLWPTFTLWRLEYFGMSAWIIIVLPNMAIWLWASSRVAKQTLPVSQKHAVWGLMPLIFGCAFFFTTHGDIENLATFVSSLGFYTFFVYLPVLFLVQKIMVKRRHQP